MIEGDQLPPGGEEDQWSVITRGQETNQWPETQLRVTGQQWLRSEETDHIRLSLSLWPEQLW